MLSDFTRLDHRAPLAFDVLIVGAGAVGLTMAIQLVRRGLRVGVLEAGGTTPTQASQAIFEAATSTGRPLDGLTLGRFRALGGTTNFWGGQLQPFDPLVFAHRPWVSDQPWPVSRPALEPHYQAVRSMLGVERGIGDDAAVWAALHQQVPADDEDLELFFSRWAPEPGFARLFEREIAASKDLEILVNAPVSGLIGEGPRLSGVSVRMPDGRQVPVGARRVVLANGTIEIVRLLLCGYADGGNAPWLSNPWLGRGFMDHVDSYAGQVVPIDARRFHALFDNAYIAGLKYSPKLKLSPAAQQREQLLGIAAHFVFNSSAGEHLANLKTLVRGLTRGRLDRQAIANLPGSLGALRFVLPMALRYLRHRRMLSIADRGIALRLNSEQRPLQSSRISLLPETDPLGMRRVTVNWQFDTATLRTMSVFSAAIKRYLESRGLASVTLDPALVAGDPAFLDQADDAYHQMGGARMSADAGSGVVDPDLRVHGADNLYVAGAAVYPTSGFANPTFTAMALGLRLAGKLADER